MPTNESQPRPPRPEQPITEHAKLDAGHMLHFVHLANEITAKAFPKWHRKLSLFLLALPPILLKTVYGNQYPSWTWRLTLHPNCIDRRRAPVQCIKNILSVIVWITRIACKDTTISG